MELRVVQRFARISPRKVRPLAYFVKGKFLEEVLTKLPFLRKKAAGLIVQLAKQAKVLAEERGAKDQLYVKNFFVNVGPAYKRRRIESRGRASLYKHRLSHITLIVSDEPPTVESADQGKRVSKKVSGGSSLKERVKEEIKKKVQSKNLRKKRGVRG
jgi:large subunit ribosomal protein L22